MPPAACGLSYLFQARLVVAQRIDAALGRFLSGHCATESRKAAPGPGAWPAESPGGHVGQPDVSSAVVALTRDEQRVEQLVVVIFDLFRHWCPRSCLASISAAGSPWHGGTGRRWPRCRARVADFCWRPGQTSAATITRMSSRPTTAAADGPIPAANTACCMATWRYARPEKRTVIRSKRPIPRPWRASNWTAPGILEAVKPGRMQGHGGTAEVSGGAA